MASNTASDFNNIDVDLEAARHGSHSFVTAPPPPVAQQQANATNASSSKLSAAAASGNDDETTALNFDTPNNPTNSIDLSTASATPNVAIPIATAGGTANTGIQPEGGSSTSNQADSGVEQEAFTFDEWWPKEKLLNVKLSDSMAEAKFREERVGKLALAATFFATLQAALLLLVLGNNQSESSASNISDTFEKILICLGAGNTMLLMAAMLLALYTAACLNLAAANVKEGHAEPYSFWAGMGLVQVDYRSAHFSPWKNSLLYDLHLPAYIARKCLLSNLGEEEMNIMKKWSTPGDFPDEIAKQYDTQKHLTPLESMTLANRAMDELRFHADPVNLPGWPRLLLQDAAIQNFRKHWAQDNVSYYDACRICYGCAGSIIIWLMLYLIAQSSMIVKIVGITGPAGIFLSAILPSMKFIRKVKHNTKIVREETSRCRKPATSDDKQPMLARGPRRHVHVICMHDNCLQCNCTRVVTGHESYTLKTDVASPLAHEQGITTETTEAK